MCTSLIHPTTVFARLLFQHLPGISFFYRYASYIYCYIYSMNPTLSPSAASILTTFAGGGGGGDGVAATSTQLLFPIGVALDSSGIFLVFIISVTIFSLTFFFQATCILPTRITIASGR